MKRSLLFESTRSTALVVAGTALVAGTYGLVRLAYGLVLPDVRDSMTLGPGAAGAVAAGASAAFCLAALVAVVVPHRPRLLLGAALLTASLGSLGTALAPDLRVLVPSVVVASAASGFASPALVTVVARTVSAVDRDRAQATVNAGTGPGLVAAGVLALVLPHWRVLPVVAAVVTAAAGAAVLLLDRPGPPWTERSPADASPRWLAALVVPGGAAFLLGATSAATWTWGPTHLAEAGLDRSTTVLAWVALGIGGTATVLTAGTLAARPAPWTWTVTAAALAAATVVLGVAPGRLVVAIAACVVLGWSFVAATSALIAWAAVAVPDHAAAGTSALFIALVLGQAAGSAGSGLVADAAGLTAAFVLAALVGLAASACGLPRPRVDRGGQLAFHSERKATR